MRHVRETIQILGNHEYDIPPYIVPMWLAADKVPVAHRNDHTGERPIKCDLCSFETGDVSFICHDGWAHANEFFFFFFFFLQPNRMYYHNRSMIIILPFFSPSPVAGLYWQSLLQRIVNGRNVIFPAVGIAMPTRVSPETNKKWIKLTFLHIQPSSKDIRMKCTSARVACLPDGDVENGSSIPRQTTHLFQPFSKKCKHQPLASKNECNGN